MVTEHSDRPPEKQHSSKLVPKRTVSGNTDDKGDLAYSTVLSLRTVIKFILLRNQNAHISMLSHKESYVTVPRLRGAGCGESMEVYSAGNSLRGKSAG